MILAPLECWPPPRFDCILPLLTKVAFPRGTPSTSFQFLRYLWSSITREFRSPESDLCSIELMPVHTFTRPRYIDPSIYLHSLCVLQLPRYVCRNYNFPVASAKYSRCFDIDEHNFLPFYPWLKLNLESLTEFKGVIFRKKKEMILMALPSSEKFSSDT